MIIFKDNNTSTVEDGDILRIQGVNPAILNNQKSRVFVVKKFEILEKSVPQIGQPELVKEDNASKEKLGLFQSNNLSANTSNIKI